MRRLRLRWHRNEVGVRSRGRYSLRDSVELHAQASRCAVPGDPGRTRLPLSPVLMRGLPLRKLSALVVMVLLSAAIGTPSVSGASFTAQQNVAGNVVTTGQVLPPVNLRVSYGVGHCVANVQWSADPTSGASRAWQGVLPTYTLTRQNPDGSVVTVSSRGPTWTGNRYDYSADDYGLSDETNYTYTVTASMGKWTASARAVYAACAP